jgi:hypothetical protein
MTIHIFGNPDLPCDALPVRLMPRLEAAFPDIHFRLTDPNELDLPEPDEDFIALDTVDGLKDVREIGTNEIAAQKARSTAHDYDFASWLLLAQKLRPGLRARIIGIPMEIDEETAFEKTREFLSSL